MSFRPGPVLGGCTGVSRPDTASTHSFKSRRGGEQSRNAGQGFRNAASCHYHGSFARESRPRSRCGQRVGIFPWIKQAVSSRRPGGHGLPVTRSNETLARLHGTSVSRLTRICASRCDLARLEHLVSIVSTKLEPVGVLQRGRSNYAAGVASSLRVRDAPDAEL